MRLPFAFLVKEESDDLLTQVAGNRHNLPLPHSEEKFGMSSRTCVFVARRIITMNPSLPSTTHVAVRDRRILGYGDADAVGRFADAEIDGRFADKFIMPGFVEGHCHLFEGALWRDPYLGFFDRRGPDGRMWPGLKSIDSVVERLRQHEKRMTDADAPVSGWGFDPIFFGGRRMNRGDLDRVSTRRPVLILHASGHIMNANGVVLDRTGYNRDFNLDGLVRDDAGELQGPVLMQRAARVVGGFLASRAPRRRRFAPLRRGRPPRWSHHRDRPAQRPYRRHRGGAAPGHRRSGIPIARRSGARLACAAACRQCRTPRGTAPHRR